MQLQWKHHWSALSYVATCGFATLPVLWEAPSVVGSVAAAVAGAVAVAIGRHEIQEHPLLRQWDQDLKLRAVQLLSAGAGAHVVWVYAADQQPQAWPAWMAALLAISTAEVGAAWLLERTMTRRQRRQAELAQTSPVPTREVVRPETQDVTSDDLGTLPPEEDDEDDGGAKVMRLGRAIFTRAQLGAVELDEWRALGYSGVAFTAQIPDRQNQSKRKGNRIEFLSTVQHGEALAIAARRQLGLPIQSSWVQIYKEKMAGCYTVSVLTRDALADVHEYVDDPTDTPSIKDPCPIGWRSDQVQVTIRLNQNGFEVGKSQSGKSLFMHRKIARITQTRDAVQWICGVAKLYDLVADWVEPYENTGIKPPINWIAYGPRDVAEMLAAGLRIARDRQNQRKENRVGWKSIVIQLDESSEALTDPNCCAKLDGTRRQGSSLYAELSKTGKSGEVYVDRATQRGVQDSDGTHGGTIQATTDYTVAFQTNDSQEIGRATGDFQTQQPPHPGCYWIKRDAESGPEMAKGEYLQESDPSKEQLHDGDTIRDISWSRRTHDNELDERAQQVAGPAYERRHRYSDAGMMMYLRPGSESEIGGQVEGEVIAHRASDDDYDDDPTPEGGGREEAKAALAEVPGLAALLNGEAPAEAAPEAVEEPETSVEVPRRLPDRIVHIVQQSESPVPRGVILAKLRQDDPDLSEQSVQNALGKLKKTNQLARTEHGYVDPELVSA